MFITGGMAGKRKGRIGNFRALIKDGIIGKIEQGEV